MGLYTGDVKSGIVPSFITLDDGFDFTEAVQLSIQFHEIYTDTLNLECVVGVNVVERKSEDVFSLSDSSSISVTESPTDTYEISDAVIGFHIKEIHSLTIKVVDTARFVPGYHSTAGDKFYLQDPLSIAIIDLYQDELPLVEVFSLQVQEIHEDTFGVSDSSTIDVKETENENLALGETIIVNTSSPRPIATAGPLGTFCLG